VSLQAKLSEMSTGRLWLVMVLGALLLPVIVAGVLGERAFAGLLRTPPVTVLPVRGVRVGGVPW